MDWPIGDPSQLLAGKGGSPGGPQSKPWPRKSSERHGTGSDLGKKRGQKMGMGYFLSQVEHRICTKEEIP